MTEKGKLKGKSIIYAFKMENVFKSNEDTAGAVHDPYRLMIEEKDLKMHPKYGEIEPSI